MSDKTENTTATTATATEPAPHVPQTVGSITLGEDTVHIVDRVIPARKTKNGETKAARLVFEPALPTAAIAAAFVSAVIFAAEEANPGKGAQHIVQDLIRDRAVEASAAATGDDAEFSSDKYWQKFIDTKSARGDSIKALKEQLGQVTDESLAVMTVLLAIAREQKTNPAFEPDWNAINGKLGTQFSDIDQLAMLMNSLDERRADIQARIDKKEEAAEKAKSTKEKGGKKAKKADAPAPEAAPATA
jgi:hypothetical protein